MSAMPLNLPANFIELDTRAQVRAIANALLDQQEFPTGERVRHLIGEENEKRNGRKKPSATTVQDEMKKWLSDTFWPVHGMLGMVSKDPAVQRVFTDGFQSLVIGAIMAAKSTWDVERSDLVEKVDEAQGKMTAFEAEIATFKDLAQKTKTTLDAAISSNQSDAETIGNLREELTRTSAALQDAMQKQATHERALNEVRETERRRADELIHQAREDARLAKIEVDAQRQAVKKLESTIDRLQIDLNGQHERAIKAEVLLTAAGAENVASKESTRKLTDRILQLTESLASLSAQKKEIDQKLPPVLRERSVRAKLRRNAKR